MGMASLWLRSRAESIGAARLTNVVCVVSFAAHDEPPSSPEPLLLLLLLLLEEAPLEDVDPELEPDEPPKGLPPEVAPDDVP